MFDDRAEGIENRVAETADANSFCQKILRRGPCGHKRGTILFLRPSARVNMRQNQMRYKNVFSSRHRIGSAPRGGVIVGWLTFMLVHHVGAAYDWQVGTGFRFVELAAPQASKPGFTRQPASFTGIVFTNHLSDAKAAENQNRLSGSGVAVGDIDGDGLVDLYFCRLEGPNVLYRNCGNWKFEDITPSAGVACSDQYSTGAVFADVDGDGDLDLLVTALGGGTRLFLNGGSGHFTEAANAGLVRKFAATTMALGDVDGDRTLDLYVANYRTTTVRSTGLEMLNVNGKRMLKPEDRESMYFTPDGFLREFGEADILYLNDGKGAFTPLSWTAGRFLDEVGKPLSSPPKDWGLAVMFHDMNGDGAGP